MLQTDNATIGEVVDTKTIQNLPLNGRDYTTLILMNAGVIEPNGSIQNSTSFDLHGLNSSWQPVGINGERPGSVSYLIDGLSNTDMFFNKSMNLISADAIEEFKLQNGLYSAAYGMGSAQVNVAIKSGSNSLHGTAYDYFQNAALQPASLTTNTLNAINHTTNPVETPFNQNQFGFTLGGPMVFPKLYNGRNKTFWFFAYEGGREFSGGASVSSATVPTAAERQGNFTDWGSLSAGVVTPYTLYDPFTSSGSVSAGTFTRSPFPTNNVITSDPKVTISPIATKWLSYFPTPQGTCTAEPSCPNLFGILKSTITTDTYDGRIDHYLSSRDRLSGTVIVSRDLNYAPSLFPETATETTQPSRMVGLDWVRNNSSNTVNDFRAGYDRQFLHNGSVAAFGPNLAAGLGFANSPTFAQFFGLPILSISSYNAPGNANDYTQTDDIYEYADNFTWVHGKHTLTFGTDERRYQLADFDGFTAMGSLTFNGTYTAATPPGTGAAGNGKGNAFADFLMGDPYSLSAPVPYASDDFHVRATYWSFFAQDDFRVTPRLTLNLGLAYIIPKPLHSTTSDGSTINLATPGGGLIWASNSITKLVAGASFAPTYYQCCITNQLYNTDYRNFAPRIGFAWRPLRNNDKLVLRGGYGIYYDTYERFYDGENYDSNLLSLLIKPPYPGVTGQETVSPIAMGTLWLPPLAATITAPTRYSFGIETEWPNNATPYNQQWSLDTQYAFSNNLMLDIGYVGSRGLKLPIQWYFNEAYPPKVFGDPCNSVQDPAVLTSSNASCATDANFQPIDTRTPLANFYSSSYANSTTEWSNYNALQVRVEKRYSQGLQFTVNYTYSRTLDIFSAIASSETEGPNLVQNGNNIRGDYGPAGTDEPQRLAATALYQVPIGKNQKYNFGIFNWLLGGWNASGIYNVGSGLPYSILAGASAAQEGPSKLRANVLGPVTYPKTPLEWFNTADFQSPVINLGSFGNSGKGIVRGPHMEQLDLSFMKNFPLRERLTLQARADIFNAFSYSYSFRAPHVPGQTITSSPLNSSDEVSCTPGPGGPSGGNCGFGSLVSLNGLGAENLWNPRTLQLSLRLIF
jgi:hypothetical protein